MYIDDGMNKFARSGVVEVLMNKQISRLLFLNLGFAESRNEIRVLRVYFTNRREVYFVVVRVRPSSVNVKDVLPWSSKKHTFSEEVFCLPSKAGLALDNIACVTVDFITTKEFLSLLNILHNNDVLVLKMRNCFVGMKMVKWSLLPIPY